VVHDADGRVGIGGQAVMVSGGRLARAATAFWSILAKDVRFYYLKPPNVSWGIIFPLAWAAMFFIRSGSGWDSVRGLLPGLMCVSVLFGTTSLLAVTVTFEKKGRSFDRLLLAPIPLELLMLAKTLGAIVFGVLNAFVPVLIAAFVGDLAGIAWATLVSAVILIAVSSTFLGLFVAVSVSEVFEAQTFSNFFRFPMLFLCGLFFPVDQLPLWLRPLSYALPLTYGADILHAATGSGSTMPMTLDFLMLGAFGLLLFAASLYNIKRRWIA
jgi:ABC-2 type transport system permease protein